MSAATDWPVSSPQDLSSYLKTAKTLDLTFPPAYLPSLTRLLNEAARVHYSARGRNDMRLMKENP
jgi:hypothetical protein